MEAGSLTFTSDEFIVLESVEFNEDVQREERVRFYTFEEQQTDAYEHLIPQGRTTQYQRNAVRDLLHRYKQLYDTYIVPTDTAYQLRSIETRKRLPWVQPVIDHMFTRNKYAWDGWSLLMESNKVAQWYPRMLAGLPRFVMADGTNVETPTEFVTATGETIIRNLPAYQLTRTQVHSDRTIDVIHVPVDGTSDQMQIEGYYVQPRSIDIPNPLPDHPFLSTPEGRFIKTTASLDDVLPSLGAVMEHGVPVTNDPYGEAMPYLKLYDVRLQDISWSMWKSKFPPVEEFIPLAEVPPIPFPKMDTYAPSDKVLEIYGTQYFPGLSVREWLMHQDDGGEAVILGLLSKSIDNGSANPLAGMTFSMPPYPETSMEDCRLMGLNFENFNTRGVLRRVWKWNSKNDTNTIPLVCVPLEFIRQERAMAGYLNRRVWNDTTPINIFDSRIKVLRSYRKEKGAEVPVVTESVTPAREPSSLRTDVLAILNDPRRISSDKVRDIRDSIADTTQTGNIHSDAEGRFVICEHTLAILEGELETDRRMFYDKWTVKEDGFRICKSCGEQINNDDYVDQIEYTDDGFIIRTSQSLDTSSTNPREGIKSFVSGVKELFTLFDHNRASDRILFLLISLLQVLPDEKQLNPLITLMRAKDQKLGTVENPTLRIAKGALGIATAIILLQTHQPLLVPRRSFGSRPVKLTGYPRDSPKPEPYSIIDALMDVLRKTFETFAPTTIKGPEADVIRAILDKPGDVKKYISVFLTKELLTDPGVKEKLETVKVDIPVVEEPKTLIPQVAPPTSFGVIVGYVMCPTIHAILPGLEAPRTHATLFHLRSPLYPSPRGIAVRPLRSKRIEPQLMPQSDIKGLVKSLDGLKSKIKIGDEYRKNLILASRLADLSRKPLAIREVDSTQKASELRDISRGYFARAIRESTVDVDRIQNTDVSLYTLLSEYKDQKKWANTTSAIERGIFVNTMANKSDTERMIDTELLHIGFARYIMTLGMREEIASRTFEQMIQERGVGAPRDYEDQGETSNAGADNGDYGDYIAVPSNDGRDHVQASTNDDPLRSI